MPCKTNISTNGIEISVAEFSTGETAQPRTPTRGERPLKRVSVDLAANSNESPLVRLNVWDLGGQTIFYPTHQLLLTDQCLYLVVFRLSAFDRTRVDYWMRVIRARSHNHNTTPILLVGTNLDNEEICTPEYCDNVMQSLRDAYPKSLYNGMHGVVFVSCKTGIGMASLRNQLVAAITDVRLFQPSIPPAWVMLYESLSTLQHTDNPPYISWETYRALAFRLGVQAGELERSAEFLSSVGRLIYFRERYATLYQSCTATAVIDLVVLQPSWLTHVMSSMVTFRHTWVQNGYLDLSRLGLVFEEFPREIHDQLLKVLQNFEIVFALGSDRLMVPSLLPDETPIAQVQQEWGDSMLPRGYLEHGRVYNFGFLPLGFFSRLMVRALLINEAQGRVFWRHGVVLRLGNQTALLTSSIAANSFSLRVRQPRYSQSTASRTSSSSSSSLSLLSLLIDAIDTLIESHHVQNEECITKLIPCTHCIEQRSPMLEIFHFTFTECVESLTRGEVFVYCKRIRTASRAVRIDCLAPDLAFTDLRVIPSSALERQAVIGKGGFGAVYKGTFTTPHRTHTVAIKEFCTTNAADSLAVLDANLALSIEFTRFQREAFIMRFVQCNQNQKERERERERERE